jgi:WD40 repeat protein/serine/threonine protein kinase
MNTCPPADHLRRMLGEELSQAELGACAEHVEACPACRRALERLLEEKTRVNIAAPSSPAPPAEGPSPDFLRRLVDRLAPHEPRLPSSQWAASPGQALRFRVVRPHGQGGLGKVFVAHDAELQREVALKEIQERYADDPEAQARFLAEAEITGRLEHPGIVPVYGLGRYPDGRPFYATRFIQGESLEEAIQRLHGRKTTGADSEPSSLALRKLLGRFVEACNTIAYAHSRGVIHRDLKPEHIMMGPYGETFVVDWGLARPFGPTLGDSSPAAAPLTPSGGVVKTLDGAVVGTPLYMSPEQAAGRGDELGPVSDVYSLGATLYCLLTGRSPFSEANVLLLLEQVCQGCFLRPRQVKAAVPSALEAVCLKAMAGRPADRYPSPRALADDVERWLADEPVSVYREPLPAQLWRWARKHRTLVGLIAAVLSVLATVGVAWMLVSQARATASRMQTLREKAELRREEADRQRQFVRRFLYGARMLHAHRAWEEGRFADLHRLLDQEANEDVPNAGRTGRGFERYFLDRLRQGGAALSFPWTGDPKKGLHMESSADSLRLAFLDRSNHRATVYDLATGRELIALDHIVCMALSSDGSRLAGGGADSSVRVWDVPAGKEVLRLRGHTGEIEQVVFRPDGKRLASLGEDRIVKIWDLESGRECHRFAGLQNPVGLTFAPDGKFLAVGEWEEIRVCDLQGNTTARMRGPRNVRLSSARFSCDGLRLIGEGHPSWDQRVLCVWDARTGKQTLSLTRQYCTAVSLDARQAASWREKEERIKIWDATTGREIAGGPASLPIEKDCLVGQIHFSPDGRFLATLHSHDWTYTVTVWAREGNSYRRCFSREVASGGVMKWSPEGERLACVSSLSDAQHGSLTRIDVCDTLGANLLSLRLDVPGVLDWKFSPGGQWLTIVCPDKTIRLFDLTVKPDQRELAGHAVRALAFSPDGQRLVGASESARGLSVFLWNTGSGVHQATLDLRAAGDGALAFSRDGRRVVSADGGVWEAASGKKIQEPDWLPGGPSILLSAIGQCAGRPNPWQVAWQAKWLSKAPRRAMAVAFTADGSALGLLDGEKKLVLYDPVTRKDLVCLGEAPDGVVGAVFSPDAHWLAVVSSRVAPMRDRRISASDRTLSTIHVWDVAARKQLYTLDNTFLRAPPLAFSRDGRFLAIGGDRSIDLRDGATGKLLRSLEGHSKPVLSLAFSTDGDRIASGSEDSLVKVWDSITAQELLSFGRAGVTTIAFSADGQRLAAGSREGIRLWEGERSAPEMAERALGWHRCQADSAVNQQQWFVAACHLDWLARRTKDVDLLVRLGDAHAELGLWEQAAADFDRAAQADQVDVWYSRGMVLLGQGKDQAFSRYCTEMLEKFGASSDPGVAAGCVEMAVIIPGAADDPARLVRAAERAVSAQPDNAFFQEVLGAALYRVGRYPEARKHLRKAEEKAETIWLDLFLAMTHHKLDEPAESRKKLQRAREAVKQTRRLPWAHRMALLKLQAECAMLIGRR